MAGVAQPRAIIAAVSEDGFGNSSLSDFAADCVERENEQLEDDSAARRFSVVGAGLSAVAKMAKKACGKSRRHTLATGKTPGFRRRSMMVGGPADGLNGKENVHTATPARKGGAGKAKERKPSRKGRKGEMWYTNTPMFGSPARKQFEARTWTNVMSPSVTNELPKPELMRQEAVYELTCGEKDYGTTLEHVVRVYEKSNLGKTIEDEQRKNIFSTLAEIASMHRAGDSTAAGKATATPSSTSTGTSDHADASTAVPPPPHQLHDAFEAARVREGVPNPGEIFVRWWKAHEPHHHYGEYCTNLPYAKHTLKTVREAAKAAKETKLEMFLSRCAELPCFSRQMLDDLLDLPRQRIARYPLLLKAIRKHTPDDHADASALDEAIKLAEMSCRLVDRQVQVGGREQVVAIQESIDLVSLPSSKQLTLVEDAQPLMLMAEAHTFKDNKPCKVYLFRHLFFITRDSTKVVGKQMLVGRQIAIENLKVEDTVNVEGRGSIKGRVKPGELNQLLAVRNNDPALMKHSTKAKKGATLQRTFGSGQQGKVTVLKFSSETQRNEWLEAIARLKGSGVAPAQCPPDNTAVVERQSEQSVLEADVVATVTTSSPSALPPTLERLVEKEEGEEEEEEEEEEDEDAEEEEEMEVETGAVHTIADAAVSRSSSNAIEDDFDDDMEI